MPDPEIQQLAGDGLEPSSDFVDRLRTRLVHEWQGATSGRGRRGRWIAAAAAGVLVIGAVVVMVMTRADGDASITPAPTTAAGPTAGVPATAFGQLWVITSSGGATLDFPDLPTFTFRDDGTILGWDGCNEYVVSVEGVEQTAAGCLEGVVPVQAAGPFTFTSDTELTAPGFEATTFESAVGGPGAPQFGVHLRYGRVGGFSTWFANGLSIDSNGCELDVGGGFTLENDFLRFDLGEIPDCYALDPVFEAWLQQMENTGARIGFHQANDSVAWWARIGDRVTRLVPDPAELNVSLQSVLLDDVENVLVPEAVRDDLASAFVVPGTVLPSGRVFVGEPSGVDERWRVVEVVDGQYVPTDLLVDSLLPTAADERLYSLMQDTNELVAYEETSPGEWAESARLAVEGDCLLDRSPSATGCLLDAAIPIDPPTDRSIVGVSPGGTQVEVEANGVKWVWRFEFVSPQVTVSCDGDTPCLESWYRWSDDGVLFAPPVDGAADESQLVMLMRPNQPTVVSWLGCGTSCRVIGVADGAIYAIESHPDGPSTLWRLGLPEE